MSVERIDFSCKHDVWIRGEDGKLLPMDEPYYESSLIAPNTWRIRSDGDSHYLVAGDKEAIAIDSGYGAGNLRTYCQTLTDKPVRCIVNTHDHFDHTANNAYFEKAYMTAATSELATIPFTSFEGIDFPRDYPRQIVKDGDIIDLGGRTLEVIEMPDHAVGSILLLDSRERILFSGDELAAPLKRINTSVENVLRQFKRLETRIPEFDVIWPGPGGSCGPELVVEYIRTLEYILAGGEVEEGMGFVDHPPEQEYLDGKPVYNRFKVRPCDMKIHLHDPNEIMMHTRKFGRLVIFDCAKLHRH